jgi:hypothetical protein
MKPHWFALVASVLVHGRLLAADPVDKEIARKARSDARGLLLKLGEAKDETTRASILEEFGAIDPRGRIQATVDGLKMSRPVVRRLCIDQLADLGLGQVVPYFTYMAVADVDSAVRANAHGAAVKLDAARARAGFEDWAIHDFVDVRLHAIESLGEMRSGAAASIPFLATFYNSVHLDVNAQLATFGGFGSTKISLGVGGRGAINQGGAAINAPLDLPQARFTEVATSVAVPEKKITLWRLAALEAMRKIVGTDLGSDPARYVAWWESHRK